MSNTPRNDSFKFVLPSFSPIAPCRGEWEKVRRGGKEVKLNLCTSGVIQGTDKKVEIRIPTTFYEARIYEDMILSYEWCRTRGVDISPRRHGILCVKRGHEIWVEGVRTHDTGDPEMLVQVVTIAPLNIP